jgi:hypothetical protein
MRKFITRNLPALDSCCTALLLAATLACGPKADRETAQAHTPLPVHDTTHAIPAAVPQDAPPGAERHTHLKGAQTEAICTTLADVQQFYTPGQDPTQEHLSCSMIFGGQSTSDVVVLGAQGAYAHVRLYDKAGQFSEGYMRGQALR